MSKDKTQNTTKQLYLETIKELGLNESDYLDILKDLEHKEYITIINSSANEDNIKPVFDNLHNTIKSINAGYILENMSSNKCKDCEYKKKCGGFSAKCYYFC